MNAWADGIVGFFSWEAAFGLCVIVLALAIAYGMTRSAKRNRANDAVSEAATREQYANPDDYGEKEENEFRQKLKP